MAYRQKAECRLSKTTSNKRYAMGCGRSPRYGRMDTSWLIWGSLFSLIGFAVFVYGKRQRLIAPSMIGVALMLYPYFVSNIFLLVGIGALLILGLCVGSRMEGL